MAWTTDDGERICPDCWQVLPAHVEPCPSTLCRSCGVRDATPGLPDCSECAAFLGTET